VLRLFRRNRLGLVGSLLLVSVAVVAIFANQIAPYPKDAGRAIHLREAFKPPSNKHWFGTDDMGRDLFSRIVFGTRISLRVGVLSIFFSTLIGMFVGTLAGYVGGLVDEMIMRIADIFMSVPYVILGMAIAVALKPGLSNVIIAIMVVFWPGTARIMRGEVLRVREREYVEACRALGMGHWRTMWRHIVPNAVAPVLVQSTIQVGWAILLAATLSFVGVGVQPPLPEWGLMASTARRYLNIAWWYATFPGLAIVLTVMGFNLVGDWLRDTFDPYLRA